VTAAASTTVDSPSAREVADLLRGLREIRHLADDDPRRQQWLAHKRDLLERIEHA
jgi:hypothetical protein